MEHQSTKTSLESQTISTNLAHMNFFLILELEIGLLPLSRPIRGLRSTLSEEEESSNNNGDK